LRHRESDTGQPNLKGNEMYEYEIHQIRSAELIRRAENHRRVREALRARAPEENPRDRAAHRPRPRRHRVARTAS